MALSEKPETTRMRVLEDYFKQYPDTPREVILKIDLLRFGQWFTDAALAVTRGSLIKSYRLFSYDFLPMESMKRNENLKVPEHFIILGGMYDLQPVMVQMSLSPESPYVIDVVDDKLVLTGDGQVLCELRYQLAPNYYEKAFPDGTMYREIIAFGFFITVFRNCQYWGLEEECKFCDINWNARQMKQAQDYTLTAPVKKLENILEVANEIAREVVDQDGYTVPLSFLLTGGTIKSTLHGKKEDDFYGEYVEALKWGGNRRFINLQTNAKPKNILKWYRSIGLDSHHSNMEVWDKRLFEWISPAKAKFVGWDNWLKWTLDSVDVFGEGASKPIFVCGIEMAKPYGFKTVKEAVDSTTEGIEFLMSHGVIPRFNQWRQEPGAYIVKNYEQSPIPLDFYIQLMRNRYEIWKKYNLPLPNQSQLLPEARHLGVSHGTYEDYILLMENTYPPNIVDIVNQHSSPYEFSS